MTRPWKGGPATVLFIVVAALALTASVRADTLRKLSESKETVISKLAIVPLFRDDGPNEGGDPRTALPSSAFVTAASDSDGRLRLRLWTVDAAGNATPRAMHTSEGTVKEIAAIETHNCGEAAMGCFVTAVRDSDDRLRVIQWFVEPGGVSITRGATAVGQRIDEVAASPIAGQSAFIAARDFDGNLHISNYAVGISGSGPVVAKLPFQEDVFGGASRIAVTAAHDQTVAMRDSDGNLRVIQFRLPPGTLDRAGTGTGGSTNEIRIADNRASLPGAEIFTFSTDDGPTAVRTGAGCLAGRRLIGHGLGKIIGWRPLGEGQHGDLLRTREKQLEDFGGIAKKVDLLFLRAGQNRLVAAHLGFDNFCRALPSDQGKPRLQLTVWDTGSRSDTFVRAAEAHLGGDYTDIAMTEIAPSGNQRRFAVALRGVTGELKVTVWGLAQ
jgi:hypothetical protein